MKTWNETLESEIRDVLFTPERIQAKVREMGQQIERDYAGKRVLVVGILNGCFPFMADLARSIQTHIEVDFMSVTSYGAAMRSSGVVRILMDLKVSIDGRHVLLIEDIIDTGLTARYLLDNLLTRHPASLEVCALLDKRTARTVDVPIRYTGFTCPDEFVVGYGLDYDGLYRNLPMIGVLRPEVYRKT